MLCSDKNAYNLRKRHCRHNKRKPATFEDCSNREKKRLRYSDYITALPTEILLCIFSYLHIEDLYFNVRLVCLKFHKIAMLSSPWTSIEIGKDIPTHIVCNWIQQSPIIRHVKIYDRNDGDRLLDTLSKHTPNLESLSVTNTWGSTERLALHSNTICNVIRKCKNLESLSLDKVRVRSCRFFTLLANHRSNTKLQQISYLGPITLKQYNTLKQSCLGWVFTENMNV